MSRWKAAGIHLAISACIALAAATLIFGLWYPSPYSRVAGADELILLLLGVDVVIGPLLTLAVFRSGKPGLAFDLAVIAALQVGAFAYGASIVVRARPVFVVAAVDRLVLVKADDLGTAALAAAKPPFDRVSWTGPILVGSQLPTDPKEHSDAVFGSVDGTSTEGQPRYYVDYATVAPKLLGRTKTFDSFREAHPEHADALDHWLARERRNADSVALVPIVGRSDGTALLDAHTGALLDVLPIDPW